MMPISLLTVLVAGFASVSAETVGTGRLSIHSPTSLYKKEGYDHREAMFGIPPYGGSIAQQVYYADSTLCDPNVNTSKGYPRRSHNAPWPAPYILMVDRGDCTFVQKVRNAQRAGAAAVVIADNTCLCGDRLCTSPNPCQPGEPAVADDGSGGDISIPSFLMFKTDADQVKSVLKQDQHVVMKMTWSITNPDDRTEYRLFTTPGDTFSSKFLATFRDLAVALGWRAYFTPHMYIFDGLRAGCVGLDGDNQCPNLCTNNGRYCATNPDALEGVYGKDVVAESLRRLCIWNHYGVDDGIGDKWWDYVTEFQNRCEEKFFASKDCINDAYKHSGVDGGKIERCMRDSGGLEGSAPNNKLDLELSSQAFEGVVMVPSVFVNDHPLRERLTSRNVFEAICASYHDDGFPSVCSKCADCPDVLTCVREGVCVRDCSDDGHSQAKSANANNATKPTLSEAITSLIFLCIFFGVVFCLLQNVAKTDYKGVNVDLGN